MPVILIQQLARAIAALHSQGRGLLATHCGETDIHAVRCIHTAMGYFAQVADYVPCGESTDGNSQGILLLSGDEMHLSWIGATYAVSPQEKRHARLLAQIRREIGLLSCCTETCLIQLVPQYGRFSYRGQDVTLSHDALDTILNMRAAA